MKRRRKRTIRRIRPTTTLWMRNLAQQTRASICISMLEDTEMFQIKSWSMIPTSTSADLNKRQWRKSSNERKMIKNCFALIASWTSPRMSSMSMCRVTRMLTMESESCPRATTAWSKMTMMAPIATENAVIKNKENNAACVIPWFLSLLGLEKCMTLSDKYRSQCRRFACNSHSSSATNASYLQKSRTASRERNSSSASCAWPLNMSTFWTNKTWTEMPRLRQCLRTYLSFRESHSRRTGERLNSTMRCRTKEKKQKPIKRPKKRKSIKRS